jgi:outer membrane immunogenic protein
MPHDIGCAIGGAQIGYNVQFNPAWLVGIETDFSASGIKGSSRGHPLNYCAKQAASEKLRILTGSEPCEAA